MKKDFSPADRLLASRICEYIDAHLTDELTYAHLRKEFHLTQYQLSGKFPQITGITVTNYIIQKRLAQVVTKVQNGAGIEDAAYTSGFRTYSHFYKEFCKSYGAAPKTYFRSHKKDRLL